MNTTLTIPKHVKRPSAEDWDYLRERGLEYIAALNSKLWTDHNLHDPGITILEALCYAITDLGYRASFPIEDILTSDPDPAQVDYSKQFHTARAILTSRPVTLLDYRKLIIDVEGVSNGWLVKTDQEVPLFADCKKSELTYTYKKGLHDVKLRGLWKVLVEFEEDFTLGDLNSGSFNHDIREGDLKGMKWEVFLPQWFEMEQLLRSFAGATEITKVTATTSQLRSDFWNGKGEVKYKDADGKNQILSLPKVRIGLLANVNDIEWEEDTVEKELGKTDKKSIIYLYRERLARIFEIIDEVMRVVQDNRSLCEDFNGIRTVPAEEVALCADIELENDADVDEVMAEIYFQAEQYLSPSVSFYTLKQLLDGGSPVEDIFQGPILKHGFLKDKEVEDSSFRSKVYASDLINIIMDIPGVVAIHRFLMSKYDEDGNPLATDRQWTLNISDGHKVRLNKTRSKVLFFKSELPILPDDAGVKRHLMLLEGANQQIKLTQFQGDLPVPTGNFRDVNHHYPLQNDLPQTYGVGESGLPESALADYDTRQIRTAKARQLKAYLLFYDQLLANYLSQLANVDKLFSWDENVITTYFTQYLDEIKGVEEASIEDEIYVDKNILENELNDLTEPLGLFHQRRNRFLDHLLARFAERFNDYATLMYAIDRSGAAENLISDKQDFLRDYPEISSERSRGFNYRLADEIWDTNNVSGLEKRASRLLGFDSYLRSTLYCEEIEEKLELLESGSGSNKKWQVILKDDSDNIIFQSVKKYTKEDDAKAALKEMVGAGRAESAFSVEASGQKFKVLLKKGSKTLAQSKNLSKTKADELKAELEEAFTKSCDIEGMHLVEHILLRPREKGEQLFEVCLDKNCELCGDEDPYSFRASVVLPYWPNRFRYMEFRSYVEKVLRQEAPAHVDLKICWIDQAQMKEFETIYRNWLEQMAKPEIDEAALKEARKQMVIILQNLRNKNPLATLHDCRDSDPDLNPVQLGHTLLGTFKPAGDEN